jgi:hypothetical protein
METPVKLFTALKGFLFWRQPPSPPPAQFDDGLTEIARLIEREDACSTPCRRLA